MTVYITEAHAEDEWPISSGKFNQGRGPVRVTQPVSNEERCALAQRFVNDFNYTSRLVVDPVESSAGPNPFEREYAPWPLRFYGLLPDGTVGFVAHPKNCGYDLKELRAWALQAGESGQ